MSTPQPSILPTHGGVNLAPVAPLLKIAEGDRNTADSFEAAIKERFLHYRDLEKSTWEEMIKAGEEVALFMQGKQFLMPNPFKAGGWLPYKVGASASAAERRALSTMQYHTSGNLEKWLNSNPDVRVKAGVESDDSHEAAQGARIVVDHYEEKFYGPRVTIAECLEGLTFGSYIWRLRIDSTAKSITAYRQIFENREVKVGPGWGKCGDCPNEGGFEDFNRLDDGTYTCPKCHSEAFVIEPASDVMPNLVGREPVELGDFRLDLVPFASCRWDLKYHADESPWMIIRRRTTMSAVRQMLDNVKLPGQADSDVGLDVIDRLAYSGQARAGYSGSSDRKSLYKDAATVEEFWMSPDEYGDIVLPHDTATVSGQTIKGGVPLGEQFRGQRVCALGINEMASVIGFYAEDHRDYIIQGKWYAKSGTGAGRGLQDLTEVQKVFNSDHQQTHTYLRGVSTPAMLVASEVLGEEGKSRYIGTPNMNIPVPLAALSEGVTLDQLVRPAFQPQSVPAQFFDFTYNRLSEFAQFASHFLPFASGMPGVDNKTATGANITQAATNALYTPVLSVKGEVRKLVAEKLIKLYPRHFPIERYFPLGGKYGRQSGKWLSGANLDTDLIFEVVPDSWLPKNGYTKQQSYANVSMMFGGVVNWMAARKQDPKFVMGIERAHDLEDDGAEQSVVESLCFRRVRQMQQAAGLIADPHMLVGVQPATQVDPATGQEVKTGQLVITGQGAIQPPISPAEPSHELKRQWLMEYLDSDEGQEAEPVLRQAVEVLIILHTQLNGQQSALLAGQQGMVQVAGAQPQMQAQQEAQAAQGQQELAQQEQALGLEAQRAAGEQLVAETDIGREQAKRDLEVSHAATMNDLKAEDRIHALDVRREQEAMRG